MACDEGWEPPSRGVPTDRVNRIGAQTTDCNIIIYYLLILVNKKDPVKGLINIGRMRQMRPIGLIERQRSTTLESRSRFSTEAISFRVGRIISGVTETEVVPAFTISSVISGKTDGA